MAETVKLQFIIEGGGDGSGAQSADNGGTQPKTEQSKENAKTAFTVHKALEVTKQFGTQVINGSVSQIGYKTGNYAQQEQIQRGLSNTAKVVSVGTAFIADPLLGALSIVGEGISLGFEIDAQKNQVMWANRDAEQLRRRAGYNSNGNR